MKDESLLDSLIGWVFAISEIFAFTELAKQGNIYYTIILIALTIYTVVKVIVIPLKENYIIVKRKEK